MSPMYPISVHRRLGRQWANRTAKPLLGQIDAIKRKVPPTISGHPSVPVIVIKDPAKAGPAT